MLFFLGFCLDFIWCIFHNFSFAYVGRRDAAGQFICREEFYSLSPGFYSAYQDCITNYLIGLADDLLF